MREPGSGELHIAVRGPIDRRVSQSRQTLPSLVRRIVSVDRNRFSHNPRHDFLNRIQGMWNAETVLEAFAFVASMESPRGRWSTIG